MSEEEEGRNGREKHLALLFLLQLSGCGKQKGPESHIPWHGDRFPTGICMALLWADCNGSGRLMKSSNVYKVQQRRACM